jgi:hypothetical protein
MKRPKFEPLTLENNFALELRIDLDKCDPVHLAFMQKSAIIHFVTPGVKHRLIKPLSGNCFFIPNHLLHFRPLKKLRKKNYVPNKNMSASN